MQRKCAPPRRTDAVDVIDAAAPQHRPDMNDGDTERADTIMERIDRRHDVAGARRRTRAIRGGVEMAAMHVDRDHSGLLRIEIIFKPLLDLARLPIDMNLHRSLPVLTAPYRRSSRTCGCPSAPGSWLPRRSLAPTHIITAMVARYGVISIRYCGTRMPAAATCGIRASMQPNSRAPASAGHGAQRATTTGATATQPRPPVMPVTHSLTLTTEM